VILRLGSPEPAIIGRMPSFSHPPWSPGRDMSRVWTAILLVAGLLAALVAERTRSVGLTLVAGMAVVVVLEHL
jgi:hypothetical protein